ncbi:MAG: hypothetical protein CTY19_18290, partial [Methylomonas sp.]
MTIRVTSSAVNTAGNDFANGSESAAAPTPSYLDVVISGSTNPGLPNGTYDGYCLNPFASIRFSPIDYSANAYAGSGVGSVARYQSAGVTGVTEQQIARINWLLAQNLTSDSKYASRFNDGEVQSAIWQVLGYTKAQYNTGITPGLLSDNNRQTVIDSDVAFLVNQSLAAVTSGKGVVPSNTFFSMVVDPAGDAQPLIIQLQSAKLGNYVWEDANANGIQDAGEYGVDNVVVELYQMINGVSTLVATTVTGDDLSTAVVETGYYQFAGLQAGQYQVKFVTQSTMYALTAQDAVGSNDANDSDADISTGLTGLINLAAGESNQT